MIELLIANFWVFVKGLGIGFAVAAPVGPIGMLCIRTTLERGRLAGFCAGLGAAVADTIFAAIGALGLRLIIGFVSQFSLWFKIIGGLFLVAFGAHLGSRKPDIHAGEDTEVPPRLWQDFVLTLGLTLANPTTILSFVGIFAGASGLNGFTGEAIPVLIVGVFLGSAAWWLTLSAIVGMIHHMISPETMLWINRGAGAILVLFGLFTLYQGLWPAVAATPAG